jgi:octaprenyl-diphosphate synthase
MANKYLEEITLSFKTELEELQTNFNTNIPKDNPLLKKIVSHILSSGGKKIRPIITMLIAKLIASEQKIAAPVIHLATAVELIHTATLLHDDVVDNSKQRRNKLSANFVWGNKPSILVGDYIFSQSFIFMVLVNDLNILNILASTSAEIANSEVMQLSMLHRINITDAEYLQLIQGKTANLFAAACRCSAITLNASAEIEKAADKFGLNLGILFQLCDDYKDYFSSQEKLGKQPGNDFFEGKITLPLLLFFKNAQDNDLQVIQDMLKNKKQINEDFAKVTKILQKCETQDLTIKFIKKQMDKTLKQLDIFPSSTYKEQLRNVVLSLLD